MSHASTSTLARPDGADTSDYAVIHHAIRSAGYALADAAETLTIADRPRPAWTRSCATGAGHVGEILSHHGIEDTIFFPALRERAPETAAVLDQLDREHHLLDRLMEDGRAEHRGGSSPAPPRRAPRRPATGSPT